MPIKYLENIHENYDVDQYFKPEPFTPEYFNEPFIQKLLIQKEEMNRFKDVSNSGIPFYF